MTKDEFRPIIKKLKIAYRRENFFNDEDMIDLWYERLGDLKTAFLAEAVNNYIDANAYQPTIADIRAEYQKIEDHIRIINRELRTIYDRTVGTYPNSLDNKETQAAWWELIKGYPLEERIAAAEEVEHMTIDYIRGVERSDRQEVPHITDFFKGAR